VRKGMGEKGSEKRNEKEKEWAKNGMSERD